MSRITAWLLSTITVVVLMFGYHTSTSSTLAATQNPPAISSSGNTGSPSAATDSSGSGSSRSGSSGSSGSSGPGSSGSSTVTGEVAQTEWGPVQVELTVSGDQLTNVSVVQYPNGNGRDQEINSYALPVLVQETIDAQSAQIDMVSGATVTSTGYLQSLQSALDQAGL